MKNKKRNIIIFLVFSLIIFCQCVLYHYYCFHSLLISTLWRQPLYGIAFYLPKLAIAMLLATSVFFMKRKWGVIVLSLLIDVWLFANIVYHRSYGMPLDAYAMMMAGNMRGFWEATTIYFEWKDIVIFLISAFLIPFGISFSKVRSTRIGLIALGCSLVLNLFTIQLNLWRYQYFNHQEASIVPIKALALPFSLYTRDLTAGTSPEYDYSIIHYIGYNVVDWLRVKHGDKIDYSLTEEEKDILSTMIGSKEYTGNKRLVIVLVESLENWAIRPEVTPNIYKLINSHHNLWATKIKSQVAYGSSADGQLIVNTGLLPCSKDAVCYRYPFNTFPTYPKKKSATILPHPISVWNQACMSKAYSYDTTIVKESKDSILFQTVIDNLDMGYDMIQVITMTSHAPFGGGLDSKLTFNENTPSMMADYMRCINVTDVGLGILIDKVLTNSKYQDVTLVITGDHTIFPIDKRQRYAEICKNANLNYTINEAYCPLIIYSQCIERAMINNDTAYQMDIYPTIMNVLKYDDAKWKGLGASLYLSVNKQVIPPPHPPIGVIESCCRKIV